MAKEIPDKNALNGDQAPQDEGREAAAEDARDTLDPHRQPRGGESQSHEVRAGLGDAGAQEQPELLPKTPKTPKASFARIALWFVVPLAVLLALYWAMMV